ncbi:MAG: tRNA pseudouridine(38-40) synthase TruA [Hyphomicrobiales bacterium]
MTAKRFAATVSYDGARFAGSQKQANGRTVQGELETAACTLFGTRTRVEMAGRTDSGVHAIGQVAAFTAETRHDANTVGRAFNANLAEDLAVRDVREVPADFDPRRWARRRWYRYTVWNAEARQPLLRRTALHVREPLDVEAMQRASEALIGRQDFIACSGPLEPGRTSVRTVSKAGWHSESCALLFDIEADAFLPQMVRRIVGGLLQVGRRALEVEEFVRVLNEARPGTMGPTAPAHGLCLQRVWYDEGYLV